MQKLVDKLHTCFKMAEIASSETKIPLWQIDLNPTLYYDMDISGTFLLSLCPVKKDNKGRCAWVGITPQLI